MKRQKELLEELLSLLNRMNADNFFSEKEVGELQGWCNDNGVEFIGEHYNLIIEPLQQYLDNGDISNDEYNKLVETIKRLKEVI